MPFENMGRARSHRSGTVAVGMAAYLSKPKTPDSSSKQVSIRMVKALVDGFMDGTRELWVDLLEGSGPEAGSLALEFGYEQGPRSYKASSSSRTGTQYVVTFDATLFRHHTLKVAPAALVGVEVLERRDSTMLLALPEWLVPRGRKYPVLPPFTHRTPPGVAPNGRNPLEP